MNKKDSIEEAGYQSTLVGGKMFDFYISISKKMPLNLEKLENFFRLFYKEKIMFEKFVFFDIIPDELTWKRYYESKKELKEIEVETLDINNLIKYLNEKYLNEFTMVIDKNQKIKVVISPYVSQSYEISFSDDFENIREKCKENVLGFFIEKLISLFEPDYLVSGIEESVLTINENNFYQSNNMYKFYTSNLKVNKNHNNQKIKILKNGILFTNKEFLSTEFPLYFSS